MVRSSTDARTITLEVTLGNDARTFSFQSSEILQRLASFGLFDHKVLLCCDDRGSPSEFSTALSQTFLLSFFSFCSFPLPTMTNQNSKGIHCLVSLLERFVPWQSFRLNISKRRGVSGEDCTTLVRSSIIGHIRTFPVFEYHRKALKALKLEVAVLHQF